LEEERYFGFDLLWDRSEGCKRPVSGDGDGRARSERERVLLCIWRDVLCRRDIDGEMRNETDEYVRRITIHYLYRGNQSCSIQMDNKLLADGRLMQAR